MCGICGFVNLAGQPIDARAGRGMMERLRHRGPDGEGHVIFANQRRGPTRTPAVFLGHRRLKIIDLTDAARQPLASEDGQTWVVFNGEIYNFRQLRGELETAGHRFRSHSDTETIIHAYEEFGDDFVRKLDGMFAFALWDSRRARLILARDRTGKKPLYYAVHRERVTFASEIKALLACPWVARDVAVEQVPLYLVYGYVPAPHTMYRGVLQVPPASTIVIDERGPSGPTRFWEPPFGEVSGGRPPSLDEAAAGVRERLTAAVSRRLISDVPLGALLSGGLDSSIVVGIMARLMDAPVRTFSVGFEDAEYDERSYAASVAAHFRTDHTEFVVRPDAAALAERLLWHHDQPYGDSSAIPTYLVCEMARRHVTVALNGDGADEVFAGYDRFAAALVAARMPRFAARLGALVPRVLPMAHGHYSLRTRLERFFDQAGESLEERYLGWVAYFRPSMVPTILADELRAEVDPAGLRATMSESFSRSATWPILHRLLYLNFMTYLPDDLHVKMDRMSMAHGLETRSPMLDTSLVEYAASLPPEFKVGGGQLKRVLRVAFKDMLPPAIGARKKHGFAVPLGRWFRAELRAPFEDLVLAPGARVRGYIDQAVALKLWKEHHDGVREHGQRLWLLFNLGLWTEMTERSATWAPAPAEPDLVEPAATNQQLAVTSVRP
jgi:asparagine synthase (glutamine-hydrolysing)